MILSEKKGERNTHGQHNLMRQSVKGTKWITKCRVGLWVGGFLLVDEVSDISASLSG